MFDLDGKCALVTGASGGIGRAIARALHDSGAVVGLSGTRRDALEELAGELGSRAHVAVCDLTDGDAVAGLAKSAGEAMGGLDILVNNAGITRDGLAMRMADEDWQGVMEVNLTAGFRIMRSALRGMMKQRWGRVINIGSVSGLAGNAGQANYAAAKAGLVGFTRAVAREMGSRNITANLVMPGLVITELTKNIRQEIIDGVKQRLLVDRMGTPEDISACVVYLASDEAEYITGQVLSVDGGLGL